MFLSAGICIVPPNIIHTQPGTSFAYVCVFNGRANVSICNWIVLTCFRMSSQRAGRAITWISGLDRKRSRRERASVRSCQPRSKREWKRERKGRLARFVIVIKYKRSTRVEKPSSVVRGPGIRLLDLCNTSAVFPHCYRFLWKRHEPQERRLVLRQ